MTDTPPLTPPSSPPTNRSGNRRGLNSGGARWPRHYLLQILNTAVESGLALLNPITREDAESLSVALRNVRRTRTAISKNYITPEMQLVTPGHWTAENGGTLPIYYSRSDQALPAIIPAGDRIDEWLPSQQMTPAPQPAPLPPPTPVADPDENLDVDDYVASLLKGARSRDD